jgi:hypothetical protein
VLIQATPKAVCTLNQTTVKKRHLQYDADDRGIVRFYVSGATICRVGVAAIGYGFS